jgi:hypothetical protein
MVSLLFCESRLEETRTQAPVRNKPRDLFCGTQHRQPQAAGQRKQALQPLQLNGLATEKFQMQQGNDALLKQRQRESVMVIILRINQSTSKVSEHRGHGFELSPEGLTYDK